MPGRDGLPFPTGSSRLHGWKNRAGKRAFSGRKSENWFSERLPRMGAKKKLVARISKSEPLILKSKPLIFCPVKTRPAGAGDQWPFGHKTVCYMPRKRGQNAGTRCPLPFHRCDESRLYGGNYGTGATGGNSDSGKLSAGHKHAI